MQAVKKATTTVHSAAMFHPIYMPNNPTLQVSLRHFISPVWKGRIENYPDPSENTGNTAQSALAYKNIIVN